MTATSHTGSKPALSVHQNDAGYWFLRVRHPNGTVIDIPITESKAKRLIAIGVLHT